MTDLLIRGRTYELVAEGKRFQAEFHTEQLYWALFPENPQDPHLVLLGRLILIVGPTLRYARIAGTQYTVDDLRLISPDDDSDPIVPLDPDVWGAVVDAIGS